MRVFVDTSTLFKKYVEEAGSRDFEAVLSKATEIAVSPITWVEINAALEKSVRGKLLSADGADRIRAEARKDFAYFQRVLWNENFETRTVSILRRHDLKTLDALQLAAGILSESDMFVTSDKKLYQEAKKIVRNARLI